MHRILRGRHNVDQRPAQHNTRACTQGYSSTGNRIHDCLSKVVLPLSLAVGSLSLARPILLGMTLQDFLLPSDVLLPTVLSPTALRVDRAQIVCQTPRRSLVALCLHSPLSHIRQTIWTCGGWSLSRHNKCTASLWMYLLRHHRHSSATISKDLIIFIQLLHLDTSAI